MQSAKPCKIHELENVGDGDLWFTTVEFRDSANELLEIGPGTVTVRIFGVPGEEKRSMWPGFAGSGLCGVAAL